MQNGRPPGLDEALKRVRKTADLLTMLERKVEEYKYKLAQEWKTVPHFPVPHERPCHVCFRPTFDMFGDRPQCKLHPLLRAGKAHVRNDSIKDAKGRTLSDLWLEITNAD